MINKWWTGERVHEERALLWHPHACGGFAVLRVAATAPLQQRYDDESINSPGASSSANLPRLQGFAVRYCTLMSTSPDRLTMDGPSWYSDVLKMSRLQLQSNIVHETVHDDADGGKAFATDNFVFPPHFASNAKVCR